MPQFVVLLRGVNVGKGHRVPMATFRSLLEAQGFAEVRTLLNSGNALFSCQGRSAEQHARTIATCLHKELGLTLDVVVKSSSEFLAAVAGNTLTPREEDHSRFLVAFSQDQRQLQEVEALLLPLVQPPERFVIGRHAAYLYCAGGILESRAATALLGKRGRGVTTRNWATVRKLGLLLGGESPNRAIERTASSKLGLLPAASPMQTSVAAESPAAYVASLGGWRGRYATALRSAVLDAAPLREAIKWGHLVYFSNGPVLLIRAEESRILFGFWRGQRLRGIEPRLKAGGKYEMATLELLESTPLSRSAVLQLVETAVALNGSLGDPTEISVPASRRLE